MTHSEDETDEDIAQGVLPEEVTEVAVPVELDTLFPWHRPRKQVVRERQWRRLSTMLLGKLLNGPALRPDTSGRSEVRYLTLPGIDYLDVRVLAECSRELGCVLTSTGFLSDSENTRERARAQFREEALVKAGYITDRSTTYGRRLEEITSIEGQAYRELRRRGPFHIVNIDACGSIAPPLANHSQRMVDAIYRIVELQLEVCSHRWLLFVTTDVTQDGFSPETMGNLCSAILANARESDEFRDGTVSLFGDSVSSIEDAVASASSDSGDKFVRLFSLGFAKWLLHLSLQKGWHLKMHNSYCYSTMPEGNDEPTMPCLAFEFVPPIRGLVDNHGVTAAEPASGSAPENLSIRALEKVSGIENLDLRMRVDSSLRLDMMRRTKDLLEEAGYAASALAGLDEELDSPSPT